MSNTVTTITQIGATTTTTVNDGRTTTTTTVTDNAATAAANNAITFPGEMFNYTDMNATLFDFGEQATAGAEEES